MGCPYSLDLRERVVAAIPSGMSYRETTKSFIVGDPMGWARDRETGSPAALAMGGKRPLSLAIEHSWMLVRLEAKSDLTLRRLLLVAAPHRRQDYSSHATPDKDRRPDSGLLPIVGPPEATDPRTNSSSRNRSPG